MQCEQPSGTVTDATDCDDSDGHTFPGADEYCDGHDDDCDGEIDEDEALDVATWYADTDNDGYGDSATTDLSCDQPSGFVSDASDCDDSDKFVHPGADEYCDGHDDDCDGDVDEDDALDADTWYLDDDGDGYGDASSSTVACSQPSDYVSDDSDCDDTDPSISPAATELCNGVDDDCDSGTSEDGTALFDDGSTLTDYTSTQTGTSSAPADVALSSDGTLTLCEGTWYVNLDVEADVDIVGASGDETAVVLDGAAMGSVVAIETDGLEVSLADLTLQNGYGDVTVLSSNSGGGGLGCDAASSVRLDNVVVDSNASPYYGGGIGLNSECSLVADAVTLSNNTGTHGAGIWLRDATAEFYDSFLESNVASSYGGLFYAYYGSIGSELYLEDTSVSSNSTTSGNGIDVGLVYTYSTVECVGDSSSAGLGFDSHSGGGSYGALYSVYTGAELRGTNCDFDATSASVVDIDWQGEEYSGLSADENFICDDDGCRDLVEFETGAITSSSTGTTYGMFGTVTLADEDTTIASFSAYAQASTASCQLDWYVLSASSATASSWTVEWSSTGDELSTTAGWHSSGDVGLEVSSGTYYALAYAADCGNTYYYSTSGLSTDGGFGVVKGYVYDAYSAYGSTASPTTSTSYAGPFGQRVVVTSDW